MVSAGGLNSEVTANNNYVVAAIVDRHNAQLLASPSFRMGRNRDNFGDDYLFECETDLLNRFFEIHGWDFRLEMLRYGA